MKVIPKFLYMFIILALAFGALGMQTPQPVQAVSPDVRISQAYGGGGNSGATYTHDFIELFNASNFDVNLAGWSVQYASATGNAWSVTLLSGTIPANSYFLIQEAKGSGGTTPLPTPDLIGSIQMSGSSIKVALSNSTATFTEVCPTNVVDFVGAGSTVNCYEGSAPAPAPSNTTSVIRQQDGCQDTDDNSADFVTGAPTPRNTSSATKVCTPAVHPERFIISEYIEGSSNNKALELFNGTGVDINLQDYKLVLSTDGSTAPGSTLTWTTETILANNETYVIANASAIAPILALADITHNVTFYSGDDALVLYKITPEGDVVQDSFGQLGYDPGTYWGSGDTATAEHTLVRKANICSGDTIPGDSFEPSIEWDGYPQDTYTDLGSHTMTCGPAVDVPPTVSSTVPANSATNVAPGSNIEITFSEPVTVTEGWYSISCATSGAHTAVVTDANPIFTLNPDSDFSSNEVCTVTVFAANVADQDEPIDPMAADHVFSFTTAEACGDNFTPIYEIQGSGMASPVAGQTHTTEGVVVGDFQTGGKNGFYIQDEIGDADTSTSDGIFIYYSTAPDVIVGDKVRVTGAVSEFNGLTEITGSAMQICSTGHVITPTEITLPVESVDDFEIYEGMLVTFPQSLIISEYFNYDRYGEIVLTSERHMTPTAIVEPGAPAQAAAAAYLLDRITLDDGRTVQNPDPAIHPNGLNFTMENLFRGGGTLTDVTGILDYFQNLYRVQPTRGAIYEDANPRTAAPEIIEADFKVASFNVLNFFVTLDGGGNICAPSGNQNCRGADSPAEFDRQRAKILAALDEINADVYGLMEIENDRPGGADPVANLVAGLNDIQGAGTYSYINTGSIGTDAIKQAILYKPAAVTPVGTYKILDSSVDARFADTANRPVLAQVFEDNISGEQFVVAVNHLKSKGSACADDPDLGDGQGNCNLTRLAAAQAMVDWLANPAYFDGIEKVLIIGDLNSYDKEDPIDAIKMGADDTADTDDDYLDMIFEKQGDNAYGYVFDGQTGYLDHALANLAMAGSIVDTNFWHSNADEPDIIDYNLDFKPPSQQALFAPDAYRASDHDPVIVTVNMIIPPVAQDQSVSTPEDTTIDITLVASNPEGVTLVYEIVDQPLHGDVTLVDDVATYIPDADYNGSDSFTFKVSIGTTESNTASVSITVTPVNDAPEAEDQSVSTTEDTSVDITLVATDVEDDALTYAIVAQPANGTVTLLGNVATFTPNADFNGTDSFTFKANDGELDSNVATVTITVTPVNDAPVALDQSVNAVSETPIEITLQATDVDGDPLTYLIVDQPLHGTLVIDGNVATYTPEAYYSGADSFTFKANDGTVDSNTATVTIDVARRMFGIYLPLIAK